MGATVLFNYDKSDFGNVRPESKAQLDSFISSLKTAPNQGMSIQSIDVIGHADRANGTHVTDYNARLAQKRAETIKQYLISQGVTIMIANVASKSDSEQVVACDAKFKSKAELQDCLLPNRRVQLVANGLK
jgi:OmpA-OmpF porin, OOP family